MPVIGFLSGASPGPSAPFVAAFRHGLIESGYTQGQNLTIDYRWAEGHYDRLLALAAARRPQGRCNRSKRQPRGCTRGERGDLHDSNRLHRGRRPVAGRLVANLTRPDGNLTGVSSLVVTSLIS
jgi:putative ABC transport system substrate-binding protein